MPPLDFTHLGNFYPAWCITAEELLITRDTLKEQRMAVLTEMRQRLGEIPKALHFSHPRSRSRWVEIMLLGFAVENLLKAYWLFRGNKMYVTGAMVHDRALRHHDLAAIADYVGFATNAAEHEALDKASYIMMGVGRYPIAAKPDPNPKTPNTYAEWREEWEIQVEGVVQKIQGILGHSVSP